MEIFWKTIGIYNSATWMFQLAFVLCGAVLTVLLAVKPGKGSAAAMKAFLTALYLWIAVVYFLVYCSERSFSNVMAIFWFVLAASWLWDLRAGYTVFGGTRYKAFSLLLMSMPFIYPLVSLARGMTFPVVTSPVMPCSVVVYTFGVMLMFCRRANLFIVLLLCHWSLIGLSKTVFFDIPEDYMMTAVSVPAVYLFFRDYYLSDRYEPSKPRFAFMQWFLAAVCAGVALLLVWAVISGLAGNL